MEKDLPKKNKIKNKNSKITTNSQLSTPEPKNKQKKKQTKQKARTGTESKKWRSHGGLSAGREVGRMEEQVENGRWKIDRGRVRGV